MPVNHPKFGPRELVPHHWYTTAQMTQVGQYWQNQNPQQRLFCVVETTGRIGLESLPDNWLDHLPYEIICPVNKGGFHWVSFAIKITKDAQNRLQVDISYSDSLSKDTKIPICFTRELYRIRSLFINYDKKLKIRAHVNPNTWMQSDGSSCGPYSFANAQRFLEEDNQNKNPGQKSIREQQLLMMDTPTSVIGCSISIKLDDILILWITNHPDISPENISAQTVQEMVSEYATHNQEDRSKIDGFVRQELKINEREPYRHIPIRTRIMELKREYAAIIQKPDFANKHHQYMLQVSNKQTRMPNNITDDLEVSPDSYGLFDFFTAAEFTSPFNLFKVLETIHQTISAGATTRSSYDFIIILAHLHQQHVDTALEIVSSYCGMKIIPEDCLKALLQLSQQNDPEWQKMGKACSRFFEISALLDACKDQLRTINAFQASEEAFNAHMKLLHTAVTRNSPSYLMSVVYAVNDFCATFLKFLSFGVWEPEYEKIDRIKYNLSAGKGQSCAFFNKQLDLEIESLDNCIKIQKQLVTVTQDLNNFPEYFSLN